jgi:hypothetical protein
MKQIVIALIIAAITGVTGFLFKLNADVARLDEKVVQIKSGVTGPPGPSGPPARIESGTWEVRNTPKKSGDETWTKFIKFSDPFKNEPHVIVFLQTIDFETGDSDKTKRSNGIAVYVEPNSVTRDGFTIAAHQWLGVNYAVRVGWLAIEQ